MFLFDLTSVPGSTNVTRDPAWLFQSKSSYIFIFSGTQQSTVAFSSVTSSSDGGNYKCVAVWSGNTFNSDVAELSVSGMNWYSLIFFIVSLFCINICI